MERELYEKVCELAPDGRFVVDGRGRVVFWNGWLAARSGVSARDAAGRTVGELFDGHGEGRAALEAAIRQALDEGSVVELPRARTPRPLPLVDPADGATPVVQSVTVLPLAASSGERHALVEVRDATGAARRSAELDDFFQRASHDLKAPLRHLMAWGRLLREDLGVEPGERVAEDLGAIERATRRMTRAVGGLVRAARARTIDMEWTPVRLDDCLDEALHGLRARVAERGARIERAPLPEVRGSAPLLRILLDELLSNALVFSDDPVRIEVTCERSDGGWTVGVRDHGPGVDERDREHLFEPYRRRIGRENPEGAGIGLSICARIVERHGGRIWCESRPGEGAHFKVTLRS